LCTFSAIGYIGLIMCIFFATRLNFRNVFISVVAVFILLSVASVSPVISARFLSISDVISVGLVGDENLSVFVNVLNLNITKSMLLDYPIFGLGIGSYRVYSIPYLETFIAGDVNLINRVEDQLELFTLTDGGAMYLRLLAELGIAGCVLFFFLMLRGGREQIPRQHLDIAKAALLFIVVFSLRSGQLIRFDFIFFCALYSLIWMQNLRLERGHFRKVLLNGCND